MAAVSGNYLYFWHVKDYLKKFKGSGLVDQASQEKFLKEEGGVQPYVIWLSAILIVFGILFADQFSELYVDGLPIEPAVSDPQKMYLEE